MSWNAEGQRKFENKISFALFSTNYGLLLLELWSGVLYNSTTIQTITQYSGGPIICICKFFLTFCLFLDTLLLFFKVSSLAYSFSEIFITQRY